jgi:hypothetical protein
MDSPNSLRRLVREREMRARIEVAELIRQHGDSDERKSEAERCVRGAMYDRAIGAITDAERAKIFAILDFAVPPAPETHPRERG